MAQVPTAVATIESGNTPPLESMGGRAEFSRGKIGEERNREGKTFSEVMDKAGKDLPSSEAAAEKKVAKSRRKDRISALNDFKSSSGSGKITGKIGLLKTRKTGNGVNPASVEGPLSDLQSLQSMQLLESNVDQPATQIQRAQLTQGSAQTAAVLTGNGELRTAGGGNADTTGKSGAVDLKKKDTGLTGSAPRVQIVDNRNKITAIDAAGNTDNPGKDRFSGKTNPRDFNGRKSARLESAGNRTPGNTLVKSEAGFAVAETDIELNYRSEAKMTERSAAAELARKLDAQAGNDIVRQVKVVLNRANTGEVRINLRPDNLGRVSVRINLDDNRLTGRIFVETAAAREAFRNALDGLQTKLVESGFGAADLELAWDDSGKEFTGNEQHSGNQKGNRDEAVRDFENIVPTTVFGETVDSRVNMVV